MELVQNPLFARYFSRQAVRREKQGVGELRTELLAGLTGRVMEVGAGSGLSFARYPASVREVVAVEPEPYLRERAREAALTAPVPVTVVEGTAAELPAADGEYDAVVVSGVLCSVSDVTAALAEISRVLRPGGELRFLEHVRSRDPLFTQYQNLVDLVHPHLMGGCHVNRDTLAAIRLVFTVESCRAFRFPPSAHLVAVSPRILGTARKAAAAG
jgi:ubiquinone/menaquinone biosynthesis C-methylase UbiE